MVVAMRPAITMLSILLLLLLLSSSSSLDGVGDPISEGQMVKVQQGVVAADHTQCSRVGVKVLRDGGHAVDASVAVALCLGVVSPASSGLGGGSFMIIRSANGTVQALDMRESAPSSASQDMYAGNATLKSTGALSVAVPGELAGLYKAWQQYGRLPWSSLVKPAELLARDGFPISPYLYRQMVQTELRIKADEGLRSVFAPKGTLLRLGDTCYNKKLAQTLRLISKYGMHLFYNGSIGLNLVRDVRKLGGILTLKDLQKYQVKLREPISAKVLGFDIIGMPPPSAGGAGMILMLNILAQYRDYRRAPNPIWVHRQIEALKHVFAVRMNLGDPDFVNVTEVQADMLSVKFAAELKKTIYDNMTFGPSHYGGRWNPIKDHGTSHVSIVDQDRNAVALTTTINDHFGAQIMSPSTGIILNNHMDDFSMPVNGSAVPPPAPANFIRPGKRPLSSMTPTIVLKDGQLRAVAGASGGPRITSGTTEVLLNHFFRRMDPLSSVKGPRIYHQLIPNVVQYENWTSVSGDHFELPAETRAALVRKGHVLQALREGVATACQFVVQELKKSKQVAGITMGELSGVSDPRKGGLAAGF